MPFSIPDHKINEVRDAIDMVDLVSGYVTLKKKGKNFFGLCPFHVEKTPSFSVNPEKEIFHCFGCGAGGNAFTFLMRHEGISFPEAVKFLAQRAGIQLDFEESDQGPHKENETLYYLNEFAARYFQDALLSPRGQNALSYLKNRGFKLDDIKIFGLGYAPSGWDGLITEAKKESVDLQLLLKAGLILKKDKGGYYDRFRDRVMFTIRNLSGRVVAFGGRKLDDEQDSPKYINSPETAVYEKGKLLYGLYQNRDEIRKQDRAIFVEGYTDLMSLVSAGIRNVVATLGTALTEHQARLIRRYTKHVLLMYDSDTAGSAATLRGADVLIEGGVDVFVADIPQGFDPDSLVKERGAAEVGKYLETAANLFDFKLNRVLAQSPEKRGEFIQSMLESLGKHKDRIQRSLLLKKISEALEIDERVLWGELETILRQTEKRTVRRSMITDRLNELSGTKKSDKVEVAAEALVKILIGEWALADFVFSNLNLEEVEESTVFPVLSYLKNRFKAGQRPADEDLINRFNDVELSAFIVKTLNEEWQGLDMKRWAADCISTIRIATLQAKLQEVREEMRQAQQAGQPLKDLLQICMELEGQKRKFQGASFLAKSKST